MAIEHTLESPLARAVRAAGSQSAFAQLIGRSQPFVHGLLRDGKPLPAEESVLVDASPLGITKEQLRPDIFRPARATHVDTPAPGTRHHLTTTPERER
jgi:DNA-binding transcriptional regulator YdaS (Cro superfamily)